MNALKTTVAITCIAISMTAFDARGVEGPPVGDTRPPLACSRPDVVERLHGMIVSSMLNDIRSWRNGSPAGADLTPHSIRTIDPGDSHRATLCAAMIDVSQSSRITGKVMRVNNVIDLPYTIQVTDDGNDFAIGYQW